MCTYHLNEKNNPEHKAKCTRGLRVYSKPVRKLEPDSDVTSEDVVYSHPTDTIAQIPEVVLSDTEDMDIVIPSTDESTHVLPFPQVSVEWHKRQYSLSVKNISQDSLEEPYWSEVSTSIEVE